MKRLGFACKLSELHPKKGVISIPEYNVSSTTVAWLSRQQKDVAIEKLWELMKHNILTTKNLVEYVGNLEPHLRMVRLGSDILPVYTHQDWAWFWRQTDVIAYCEKHFAEVGRLAKDRGVRLSFHPGQFTCIVSDNSDVVQRSIEELEYHTDMIRWMGFGNTFQDFKCNVHLSGRLGVDGFDSAWNLMSLELRNCLTLENDEYQSTIDDLIKLKDRVAIVLDIHHHFISNHEYIAVTDERIKYIVDSWRGVRPVIHYSQSREEYMSTYQDCMPEMNVLLENTKKAKLRAHSDFYNNTYINNWALTHLDWADIMAESKSKNLGSKQLFNQWRIHTQNA